MFIEDNPSNGRMNKERKKISEWIILVRVGEINHYGNMWRK